MNVDLSIAWTTLERMARTAIGRLPLVAVAVVTFLAFLLTARLVRAGIRRVTHNRHRHRNVGLVLGRLAQAVVVFVGALVALAIVFPSFKASDLIGILGVSSVAIGFAFRDVLQNFLAGILILLGEPFRIGDQIVSGNHEGTVEEIQTRATLIRTYDGRRVVVPNAVLFTSAVVVNTALEKRRTEYDVGIGFGDDPARAADLIVETLRGVEGVLPEPAPEVLVSDLGDSAVKLRAFWWTRPERIEVLRVQDRCLRAIRDKLVENGIDLPFPTQQILFHDQTEETDGDRRRQREGWPAGKGAVPKRAWRPETPDGERAPESGRIFAGGGRTRGAR